MLTDSEIEEAQLEAYLNGQLGPSRELWEAGLAAAGVHAPGGRHG